MHALRQWPTHTVALAVGLIGGLGFVLAAAEASPMMAVAAVGGLGLVVMLLRQPVLGLYILAAMVPIERFGRLSDDTATFEISIMRMTGLVAFVVLLMHHAIRRRPLPVTLPLMLWTAYVGFAIVSLTYSSDMKGGLQIASGAFGNILFLLTISGLVLADSFDEAVRRANTAILLWLLACSAVAAYSIYDWHFGSGAVGGIPIDDVDPQAGAQLLTHRWATVWEDTAERGLSGLSLRRSMGPTSHAAVFGINLLMSLPFFFYVLRVRRGLVISALMCLGLVATVYCLFLTNTRAVLLVMGVTIGLCMFGRLLPVRAWMLAGGVAAGGVALMFLPGDIFNRILNTQNYAAENSEAIQVRLEYWEVGFRAIFDNWLMGVGVGNRFVMLSYLRNPIEGHSTMHNIYLQTALDIGLIGWAVFVGFLATTLLWTDRLRRRLAQLGHLEAYWMAVAAEVLMLTVIIFGLQVDVFFFPLKAWWLISGLSLALYTQVATSVPRPAVRHAAGAIAWQPAAAGSRP